MTGQELKGRITFWILVLALIAAVFSGNWGEAGYLLVLLVGGIIIYQVTGWLFVVLTGGRWDPFNVQRK